MQYFIQKAVARVYEDWRTHVKKQLAKGGGVLFKYVSKQDKTYLSLDLSKMGGGSRNPDEVLKQQASNWRKHWGPKPFGPEHHEVAVALTHRRKFAQDEHKPQYSSQQFKHVITKYKKQTKGCDNWTTDILRLLPDICIAALMIL